jgi:hypothetical protein
VTIVKHTDPSGINKSFSYTSNVTGTTTATGSTACPTGTSAFTLNDSATNTYNCFNVPAGNYTVTEGAEPNGFVLESLTCTAGGKQDSTGSPQADITITPDSHVTCTYVNKQLFGAIKITKTSSKAAATPLSGAHFEICTNNAPYNTSTPCTPAKTGSDDLVTSTAGTACLDGLAFGDYYVTEKTAPNGYAINDSTTHKVTVSHSAACGDATYGGESIGFTDTPLTDVLVKATSEATGGTKSTIKCVGPSPATTDVGHSAGYPTPAPSVEVDANGLSPGTYTCTVVVDP